MSEQWFCKKKGFTCPYTSISEQVRNCEDWDPRDVICDKTCRHGETEKELAAARTSIVDRKSSRPGSTTARTPEGTFLVNRDGEILVKESLAKNRIELMQRQAAAAERIAAALEKIASTLGKGGDE